MQVVLTFATALGTQCLFLRALHLGHKGYLSALVTSLGLSILLRSDSLWVHPLIACVAISSKFLLRLQGRHFYNPANLGVVIAISFLPGAWLSPGQWGTDTLLGLWFIFLGATVTQRARRHDIAWAFLGSFAALLALRCAYLGLRPQVLLQQLSSGVLLLFTFFMISDPMTTPRHHHMRLLFAVLVAGFACVWQFVWFKPNALIWSLFWLTPLVPVFNRLCPAESFSWQTRSASQT
jgi:Na+-transporting NADH:ubiquinone oxidoreductase subunit NqrB